MWECVCGFKAKSVAELDTHFKDAEAEVHMEIEKALKVKEALITLSDVLGMNVNEVAANMCLFSKGRQKIIIDASEACNEFDNADIVKRGKMLGIEITECGGG